MTSRTAARAGASGVRWQRWAAACAVLVLALGAALVALVLLPKTYESSAVVVVLPTAQAVSADTGAQSEVQIDTEAEVARSSRVAQLAARLTDPPVTAEQLLASSDITIPQNSDVLTIAFRAASPEAAQTGAQALAEAYLDQRAEQAEQRTDQVIASLQAQLTVLQAQLDEVNSAPAGAVLPDAAGEAEADAQRALLLDQISQINSQLVPLRTTAGAGGSVITSAMAPGSPVSPSVPLLLGAGVVVGLFGATAVLLLPTTRDRGRTVTSGRGAGPMATIGGGAGEGVTDESSPLQQGSTEDPGAAPLPWPAALPAQLEGAGPADGPVLVVAIHQLDAAVQVAQDVVARAKGGRGVVVLATTDGRLLEESEARTRPGPDPRQRASSSAASESSPDVDAHVSLSELGGVDRLGRAAAERGLVVVVADDVSAGVGRSVAAIARSVLVVADSGGPPEDVDRLVDELDWWGLQSKVAGVLVVPSGAGVGR